MGGFAEAVVVDQSQLVPVPADLGFDRACLLACGVITGVGAVLNTAELTPGSSAVMIGAGGVGLNAIRARGSAGPAHHRGRRRPPEAPGRAAPGATHAVDGRQGDLLGSCGS